MAVRVPLILNQTTARVEELAVGDTLDGSSIVGYTGKNRFINGALRFWQERTSGRIGVGAGSLGSEAHFADQFSASALGCTHDVVRFAPPDGKVKMVCTVSGATASSGAWTGQRVEGVKSMGGVVTVSVRCNADLAGRKVGVRVIQHFGAGGSPAADVSTEAGVITLGATDQRLGISVVLPSTAGKNVGTSGTDHIYVVFDLCAGGYGGAIAGQNGVFGFTEFQIEEGPSATDFEWCPPAIEFASCQRFFNKSYSLATPPGATNADPGRIAVGANYPGVGASTFNAYGLRFPVTMRAAPAVTVYAAVSGNPGKITMSDNVDSSGAASARGINEGGCEVNWANNASTFGGWFHYTANARL